MQKIESSDRAELAGVMDLQTRLVQVALHQSNATLHDDYIDKLTVATHELTTQIKQLELDLTTSLHDSESKLQDLVRHNCYCQYS